MKSKLNLKNLKFLVYVIIFVLILIQISFTIENNEIQKKYELTKVGESFKSIKERFGNPYKFRSSNSIFFADYYDKSFIISNAYYFKFDKSDSLLLSKAID